jgi:hypothetical protein
MLRVKLCCGYNHIVKSFYSTAAAGVALALPAYWGLMLDGVPTLRCPFPTLTVIPALFLSTGRLTWLAVLVPAGLFFLWTPGLFHGKADIPRRSWILLSVLTVLTVVYFAGSWGYGLEYQGKRFTYGICALNAGWLVLLWTIFMWRGNKKSFTNNLILHWLLFAWLGWYAFPYLGELP